MDDNAKLRFAQARFIISKCYKCLGCNRVENLFFEGDNNCIHCIRDESKNKIERRREYWQQKEISQAK